jgi:hypothetical protein
MIHRVCESAMTFANPDEKKARHEAGLTGVRRISAKDRFTMRQNEI